MKYNIMVEGDYGRASRKTKLTTAKTQIEARQKAEKWCGDLEIQTGQSYDIIECLKQEAAESIVNG